MPKSRGRKLSSKSAKNRSHLRSVPAAEPRHEKGLAHAEQVVEAAIADLNANTAGTDPRIVAVVAEAAVARFMCMIEDTMDDDDPTGELERFFWGQVAEILVSRTDEASWVVLTGLSRLVGSRARLALQRAYIRRQQTEPAHPEWIEGIGAAKLTAAILSEDITGDGYNIMLGYGDNETGHTLLLFVDNNLGGIGKDILVAPPLEVVVEMFASQDGITLREIPTGRALGMALLALDKTRSSYEAPVTDDFDFFHSLLVTRIANAGVRANPPQPDPSPNNAERELLVHGFLASPQATGLRVAESEAADIARMWIDHAVDYTIGGPLRVSSVLVELFLVDWVPRNVVADAAYLAAVPPVVKAWLGYAGERSGVPAHFVGEAQAAVDKWVPVLRSRSNDRSAWGMAKSALADLGTMAGPFDGLPPGLVPQVDGLDAATRTKLVLVAPSAWQLAGEILGPRYSGQAFDIAERIAHEAPELFGKTMMHGWPAAIVWLLAEQDNLVGRYAKWGTAGLAVELGFTAPTLKSKAKKIRTALQIG